MSKLGLFNYLFDNDLICDRCRRKFNRLDRTIETAGIKVRVLYEYNEAMASLLLQYKGSNDEALAPLFMYKDIRRFDQDYAGYTIVYIPSAKKQEDIRGFRHLEKVFENSKLDKRDILYKIKDVEQKNMAYSQRTAMAANIKIRPDVSIPDRILLVDDVITSGSSIRGAFLELCAKCSDIKVFCVSCNRRWL